jgi:hypothetical protein
MRTSIVLCVLLGITCGLGAGGAMAQEANGAKWKSVTLGGDVYYATPAEVVRSLGLPYEDIADEENAATYYLQAMNALPATDPDDEGLSEEYKAALDGPWSLDDGRFSAWFKSTQEARDLTRNAAGMAECQFPILADEPGETFLAAIMMPYLSSLRTLARLMVVEGHLLEHEGRAEEALHSYLVVLRMGKHSLRGHTLIDGLVGIALHAIGTEAAADCLARQDVGKDALAELEGELQAPFPTARERGAWISGERAMALQVARMSPAEWGALDGGDLHLGAAPRAFVDSRAFRIVWPDRTICKDFENFYDRLDQMARMPTWDAADALQDFDPEAWFKDWDVLAWMLTPAISRALEEYTRAAARHDLLQVNVALRRFRADAGKYPETLDELVPAYLNELPPDPFTGQPLHYRLEDGAWLLYSVGSDRDDDNGVEGDREDGDIGYRSEGKRGQEQ